MKRSVVVIILIVVLIGIGGLMVVAMRPNDDSGTQSPDKSTAASQTPSSSSTGPQNDTETSTSPDATTDHIDIEDMAFQPASLSIKRGTTVTWTNRDAVQHDVRPDNESEGFEGSDLLSKDESYSFTFDTPGTFTYHCSPHPQMTGTIIVTE